MTPTIAPKPLLPVFFGLLASAALFCLWRLCLPSVDTTALRGPRMYARPLRVAAFRPRPAPACGCAHHVRAFMPGSLPPSPLFASDGGGFRLVPAVRDGVPAGFRVYGLQPDAWLGRVGLQDGDLIERVDGLPIDSPTRLRLALLRLRNPRHARIDVERRGAAVELIYERDDGRTPDARTAAFTAATELRGEGE